MAVANKIKSQSYGNRKEILIAPELAFSIGCVVSGTGIEAVNGRKILKAGTPVGGADILANRQAVLSKNTEAPVGIVLHDVDVTDGDENATLVLKGQVDLLKLDEDVKTLVNTAKAKLTDIIFMNGNK